VNVATIVIAACAVIVTGLALNRELRPKPPAASRRADVVLHDSLWALAQARGARIGPAEANVTLVEFTDFQCPFCRGFLPALASMRNRFPEVAVLIRHLPLTMHRKAYPAARAAECAAEQNAFVAFHDTLFSWADSLATLSFLSAGRAAGVRDLAKFKACTALEAPDMHVETDLAAAKSLGIRWTPAIVLNGVLLASTPDSAALYRLVEAALRKPRLPLRGGTKARPH
jgi:protein-disulfide isomerase